MAFFACEKVCSDFPKRGTGNAPDFGSKMVVVKKKNGVRLKMRWRHFEDDRSQRLKKSYGPVPDVDALSELVFFGVSVQCRWCRLSKTRLNSQVSLFGLIRSFRPLVASANQFKSVSAMCQLDQRG